MRTNSRSSTRWGVATAVAVALVLGATTALAGSDGNGRQVAVHPTAPPDDQWQEQTPGLAINAHETRTNGTNGTADDGNLIRDDSDIARVDGSAGNDATVPLFGGSY